MCTDSEPEEVMLETSPRTWDVQTAASSSSEASVDSNHQDSETAERDAVKTASLSVSASVQYHTSL